MFDQLKTFLKDLGKDTQARPADDLRLAVVVLLLEAAHQDGDFAPAERAVIERLLTQKFSLSRQDCAQLLARGEATSESLVQLHPYTNAIFERMSPDERVQLIEMLWEVVYADGVLDPEEDALMRRIGGLVYVSDRDRMLARRRVVERLGLSQA